MYLMEVGPFIYIVLGVHGGLMEIGEFIELGTNVSNT